MRTVHSLEDKKDIRKKLRGAATIHEVILWSRLRRKQLGYKFRRQHSVGRYIVDFYCPEKKLIVEIDGGQHDERDIKIYDESRTNYLENLGFRVLRFWNNEINSNLTGVVDEIIRHLN